MYMQTKNSHLKFTPLQSNIYHSIQRDYFLSKTFPLAHTAQLQYFELYERPESTRVFQRPPTIEGKFQPSSFHTCTHVIHRCRLYIRLVDGVAMVPAAKGENKASSLVEAALLGWSTRLRAKQLNFVFNSGHTLRWAMDACWTAIINVEWLWFWILSV